MSVRKALVLVLLASVFGAQAASADGTVYSYVARVTQNGFTNGSCYAGVGSSYAPPTGLPANDFLRLVGACGATAPTPAPSTSPTTAPTTTPTTVLKFGQLFSVEDPVACGINAAIQAGNDLTGCSTGTLQLGGTNAWTYSGMGTKPIVKIFQVGDAGRFITFAAQPTSSGFTLRSVSTTTGLVIPYDASTVEYMIIASNAGG